MDLITSGSIVVRNCRLSPSAGFRPFGSALSAFSSVHVRPDFRIIAQKASHALSPRASAIKWCRERLPPHSELLESFAAPMLLKLRLIRPSSQRGYRERSNIFVWTISLGRACRAPPSPLQPHRKWHYVHARLAHLGDGWCDLIGSAVGRIADVIAAAPSGSDRIQATMIGRPHLSSSG
jgi:hypothetical protein